MAKFDSVDRKVLTARELEALRLVSLGLSNKEIARVLNLSPKTIGHMLGSSDPFRAIYPKIGVINRSQAARWYLESTNLQESIITPTNNELLIDAFQSHLATIDLARIQGNPLLAAQRSTSLVNQLVANIRDTTPLYHKKLLDLLLSTLCQKGWAFSETSSLGEIWTERTEIVREIISLSKTFKDSELYGLAYYFLGDAHYVARNHCAAIKYLAIASKYIEDPNILIHVQRTIALSQAFLGERKLFTEKATQVNELLWKIDAPDYLICGILEGIARAQAILGIPDAFTTLEESKSAFNRMKEKNEIAPLRAIQMVRAEVELTHELDPSNIRLLESLGSEGFNLPIDQYPRIKSHIRLILDDARNSSRQSAIDR